MDSEDAACITRIAQGDQTALDALYTRYRPRLYRFLWQQLGGDSALIEEVLQDTFLAVWRSAATFRGEARVASWVFRIALHSARQAQRGTARHATHTRSFSALDDEADLPTSPEHEEQTLTRLVLHDALARLSDKQRAVVLLIFVQGFTGEEAAEILGLPLGTIKSRLRTARALLINDPALQPSEEVNS